MMATVLTPARFAHRTTRIRPSAIRAMLKTTQQPDVISFGGGLPAAELFPAADISAAQDRVMTERGAMALQYSVTEGIPELRTWVAARLRERDGVPIDPEHVVVTGGSQQGLDLYARVLLDPGDVVAVANPSYLGAIQAFDAYEATYLTIETDEHGIIPDALEAALREARPRPKFLYVVPNYDNPRGITLAADRRPRIVAICAEAGVPILEDDPYGEIAFTDRSPAPLLASDPVGGITYLGTASKMVAPGLRVAWMVIPDPEVRERVVTAKQGADLHSSSYAQYVLHAYVEDEGRLELHLAQVRAAYRARRDAMLAALAADMPEHVRWNTPDGGMFLWATVDGIDTEALFEVAVAENVVFVPGRPFYPQRDRGDGMRLNFSAMDAERIRIGIGRLAQAVRDAAP